jgi:hypothetical protein
MNATDSTASYTSNATCEECDTEVAEGQHICKDCKFALGIFYFT